MRRETGYTIKIGVSENGNEPYYIQWLGEERKNYLEICFVSSLEELHGEYDGRLEIEVDESRGVLPLRIRQRIKALNNGSLDKRDNHK
jgi:hypothetical protein